MTTEQCSFAYCKPPTRRVPFTRYANYPGGECLSRAIRAYGRTEGFDCGCSRGKAVHTGRRFGSCDNTARRLGHVISDHKLKSPEELECPEQSWEYTCCNVSDPPLYTESSHLAAVYPPLCCRFFYFIRSLLLSKSPILVKSWCASLYTHSCT